MREDNLLRQCLEHLRALPFVRRIDAVEESRTGTDVRIDVRISIRTPTGKCVLPCEIRRAHLRKETAELLIHAAKKRPDFTVFAPSVGRELGDTFERAGINFVDAAGNCYLRIGEQYMARIQGRTPTERPHTGRGLRAPAYRVLLAVLIRPELIDAPSRTLAQEAGVSPQTANELRRRLVEQHIVLHTSGRHRFASERMKDALALWLSGFTTTLAPSLLIGRFRAQERDPAILEQRIEPVLDDTCDWRYGGGAAANRLTQYYRGERTVLYVQDAPHDLAARLRFVRDTAGPIVLARAPGRLAFESPDRRTVHPLLAYSDLIAEGDPRAREAAGELYDRFLSELGPK